MKYRFLLILFLGAALAAASEKSGDIYLQVTKELPAGNIPLKPDISVVNILNFSGADMQMRGADGMQSDISIRGSNFEQPAIFLDGIKINDPQTGHYNMDLPVAPQSISNITVDRSKGGGAVDIITGGRQQKYLSVGAVYGDYLTGGTNLNGYLESGRAGYLFNVSRRKSSGYYYAKAGRDINDYDVFNFFTKAFTGTRKRFLPGTIYAGYTLKAFGAYDFYTPYSNFPSRENTKAEFLRADFAPFENISSGIYIKQHTDIFILKETAPALYRNDSISSIYGIFSKFSGDEKDAGFDEVYENIDSTGTKGGLGRHERAIFSLYGSYGCAFSGINIKPGLRAEYNNFFNDTELLPEVSLRKNAGEKTELRFVANRSYRLPSYTELYYEDLVNKGDSKLKKESSWNYTLGTSIFVSVFFRKLSFDLFLRDETGIIDWLETSPGSRKYNALNAGSIRRQGVELRTEFFGGGELPFNFSAGYNYTENAAEDYTISAKNSKYAFRNPVHHIFSNLSYNLPFGIKNSWEAVYKDRQGEKPYTNVFTGFSMKIRYIEVSAGISNLLDAVYEEIPGVQQPGRHAELSITYRG